MSSGDKFLITRLPPFWNHFYEPILHFVARNFPDLLPHFDLQTVPFEISDQSPYCLHVPWVQDPVQAYDPAAYEASCNLSRQCDDLGIPIINRVENLANAGKVEGSERIRAAGFRTPQMRPIENQEEFLETAYDMRMPFFVRDDWSHKSDFFMVETREQLREVPLQNYQRPVACEYIDIQSPDGFYRRKRCFVIGDQCIPQGQLTCTQWKAKARVRVSNANTREEDLAYATSEDPHAERFLQAARNLGLQWVAFDFAEAPKTGEPIVWEANPYPNIDSSVGERAYRRFVVDRLVSSLIRLYLVTGGLEVPSKVERLASGSD